MKRSFTPEYQAAINAELRRRVSAHPDRAVEIVKQLMLDVLDGRLQSVADGDAHVL